MSDDHGYPLGVTPGRPIDLHCPHCQQVLVSDERMKPLSEFEKEPTRGADRLFVAQVTSTLILVNCDALCPRCGRMVYLRINEQKLNLVLRHITHD